MSEFIGSESWVLEDGALLTESVQTPYGTLERVYFGPGSIYAVADEEADSAALYALLREDLGAVRLVLYVNGKGRYDASHGQYGPILMVDALDEDIGTEIYRCPSVYSDRSLEQMQRRLSDIDTRTRGYCRSEDGTLYLYRHGKLYEASPLDGDRLFRLCLFGGIFGLHRFAMGRWFSGLLYGLTCGFFLFGWLLDLLYLLLGFQRDKRKRLVPPVTNRGKKALCLLPAAAGGGVVLLLYLSAISALSGATAGSVPTGATNLMTRLQQLLPAETLK